MNYKHQQLEGVIEYSETMLKEAESGNWESVYSIEEKRSKLIKKIYSSLSTQDENNNNQISQILALNGQIEKVTSKARDNTRKQMGSINKGRQVVSAYSQNSG